MFAAGQNHLKEVKMTYFEHALFSLNLSKEMALGTVCAAVHAVLPGMFLESSSVISNRIATRIREHTQQKLI